MSNEKSIDQIMETFPETDGNNENLEDFLAIGNMLHKMADENGRNKLPVIAKLRLRGEALQSVLDKEFPSWGDIKKHLEKKFLRVPRYLPAFTELTGMVQVKEESIREFVDRMAVVVRRVNRAIMFNRGDEKIPLNSEHITQIATSIFAAGLRSLVIKIALVDKKLQNFEDAVEAAIGFETVIQKNAYEDPGYAGRSIGRQSETHHANENHHNRDNRGNRQDFPREH